MKHVKLVAKAPAPQLADAGKAIIGEKKIPNNATKTL